MELWRQHGHSRENPPPRVSCPALLAVSLHRASTGSATSHGDLTPPAAHRRHAGQEALCLPAASGACLFIDLFSTDCHEQGHEVLTAR